MRMTLEEALLVQELLADHITRLGNLHSRDTERKQAQDLLQRLDDATQRLERQMRWLGRA